MSTTLEGPQCSHMPCPHHHLGWSLGQLPPLTGPQFPPLQKREKVKSFPNRAGYQHCLLRDAQARGTTLQEGLPVAVNRTKQGGRLRLLDPCGLSRCLQVINSTFNHRSFPLSCPLTVALLLNGETRAKKEKLTAWIARLLLSKMPN